MSDKFIFFELNKDFSSGWISYYENGKLRYVTGTLEEFQNRINVLYPELIPYELFFTEETISSYMLNNTKTLYDTTRQYS